MTRVAILFLAGTSLVVPAAAQLRVPNLAPVVTGRTALGCDVDRTDPRLLHVTNITSTTIAAETRLYIDAVHQENGQHEVVYVLSGTLSPGQVQDVPLWRATSCTAWLSTPATMAH